MALVARNQIPNLISSFRVLLVIPIAYLILHGYDLVAFLLFILAGISDGLDGYLAKRYDWSSRLGSYLDPLADKFLLVTTFIVLAVEDVLPAWLVLMIISRDLIILLGAWAYIGLIGRLDMRPLWSSKVNTFFQILLCVTVLASLAFSYPWLITLSEWLIFIVFTSVLFSGFEYVYRWFLLAKSARSESHMKRPVSPYDR